LGHQILARSEHYNTYVKSGFISAWSHLVDGFYDILPITLGIINPIGLKINH